MQVGNYKDPDKKGEDPIVDKREAQDETPATRMVEGIQANLKQNVAAKEGNAELADDWKTRLSEKDISIDKAHAIIDDLLTKGYYEETANITSRISVTFRSRTHYDFQRYLRAIEIVNPRFNDEMQEIAMRYFLAASIVRFGDTTFDFPEIQKGKTEVDKAFEVRMDWVEQQPGHLIMMLSQKLNTFDEMLGVVFSEGVIENF